MNANSLTSRPEVPSYHPRLATQAAPPRAVTESRPAGRYADRQWRLGAEETARVSALIHEQHFASAVSRVRALPPTTPELPQLVCQLVWALAHAGQHEATASLASEMLARFPLRPEVIRALMGLAELLATEEQLVLVLEAAGTALMRAYGFSHAALLELAQRIAYQFRRHGRADSSACILRTWHALVLN